MHVRSPYPTGVAQYLRPTRGLRPTTCLCRLWASCVAASHSASAAMSRGGAGSAARRAAPSSGPGAPSSSVDAIALPARSSTAHQSRSPHEEDGKMVGVPAEEGSLSFPLRPRRTGRRS